MCVCEIINTREDFMTDLITSGYIINHLKSPLPCVRCPSSVQSGRFSPTDQISPPINGPNPARKLFITYFYHHHHHQISFVYLSIICVQFFFSFDKHQINRHILIKKISQDIHFVCTSLSGVSLLLLNL